MGAELATTWHLYGSIVPDGKYLPFSGNDFLRRSGIDLSGDPDPSSAGTMGDVTRRGGLGPEPSCQAHFRSLLRAVERSKKE